MCLPRACLCSLSSSSDAAANSCSTKLAERSRSRMRFDTTKISRVRSDHACACAAGIERESASTVSETNSVRGSRSSRPDVLSGGGQARLHRMECNNRHDAPPIMLSRANKRRGGVGVADYLRPFLGTQGRALMVHYRPPVARSTPAKALTSCAFVCCRCSPFWTVEVQNDANRLIPGLTSVVCCVPNCHGC